MTRGKGDSRREKKRSMIGNGRLERVSCMSDCLMELMLAARAMLHLQESIPRFFHPRQSTSDMFPPDVFSQNLVLKLPHPLPIKVSRASWCTLELTPRRPPRLPLTLWSTHLLAMGCKVS